MLWPPFIFTANEFGEQLLPAEELRRAIADSGETPVSNF
jgi:hypothetical protein